MQGIVQNINMGKVNSTTYNNGSVYDATVSIKTLMTINRTQINVAAGKKKYRKTVSVE